jgi:hypothetical protein
MPTEELVEMVEKKPNKGVTTFYIITITSLILMFASYIFLILIMTQYLPGDYILVFVIVFLIGHFLMIPRYLILGKLENEGVKLRFR